MVMRSWEWSKVRGVGALGKELWFWKGWQDRPQRGAGFSEKTQGGGPN